MQLKRLAGIVLLASVVQTLAQEVGPATPTKQALDRRVEYFDEGPLSIRRAFVQALIGSHVPGGIELVGDCNTRGVTVRPQTGSSLGHVLEGIVAARPDLSFEISKGGGVYVRPHSGALGILDVKIRDLRIPDRNNLTGAVDRIVRLPVVQARIRELGLQEGLVELGFSGLPKPGYPRPDPIPLSLSDVTVREALDSLAELSGRAVWVYAEDACSAKRTFTISFDMR